jgi:hypothetical protein
MSAPYVTARRVQRLGRQLSDRDWAVLSTLSRVRVATARQLERLHFASVSRRQSRSTLASLTSRRLLARLPRQVGGVRAGSAGYVYVLDVAGQRLTRAGMSRPQRPWAVSDLFLAHSLAVTEVFVQLVEAARVPGNGVALVEFRTEPACWRPYVGAGGARAVLKPDAETVLALGRYEDRWFLELDRATESRPALDRKLRRYVEYWRSGREQSATGVFPRVLWVVPDEARHAVLIDACGRTPVEAWPLFAAATSAEAVSRILKGAAI